MRSREEETRAANPDVDQGIQERIAANRLRLPLTDCIFCSAKTPSFPAVIQHMKSLHSFYLPHPENLVDLPGLLAYLGEKVLVGNLCLFCPNGGKEFGSVAAVRRHMVDKSHCKLAFDSDQDKTELADYYDVVADLEHSESEWEEIEDEEDSDLHPGLALRKSSVSRVSLQSLKHLRNPSDWQTMGFP